MQTTKKILSMLFAFVLVLGLLPVTAVATEEAKEDVVYLSISFDSHYIDDKNGDPIAYVPIPMSEIEAIDLAEYGLDNMLFDADGDGNYETTALQLLIYAHEELYGGDWSEVTFDALPGSSYFRGGIFGFTENLVYFQNGDFPVDETQTSDYYTVGATSDRIVLEAGEIRYQGKLLPEISQREQAQQIGYVLQSPENQVVTDKVWHELAFGLESLGYDSSAAAVAA